MSFKVPISFMLSSTTPSTISEPSEYPEDVMEIVTTQAKEEAEKSLNTNVFIAIFTTAHARLKLLRP